MPSRCAAAASPSKCCRSCISHPTRADPRAGFAGQVRTSWLPVERAQGRCKARDERQALADLEGLAEQAGGNTGYVIHPEEILADNFALLFRKPAKIASPQVLERMRRMLLP
jgi:hypothetical protein